MSKEKLFVATGWIMLAAIVIGAMITGIVLMRRDVQEEADKHCAELGERLGYETLLLSGHCYIQVRPGLKVREDQVLDFLPVIDCRQEDG